MLLLHNLGNEPQCRRPFDVWAPNPGDQRLARQIAQVLVALGSVQQVVEADNGA